MSGYGAPPPGGGFYPPAQGSYPSQGAAAGYPPAGTYPPQGAYPSAIQDGYPAPGGAPYGNPYGAPAHPPAPGQGYPYGGAASAPPPQPPYGGGYAPPPPQHGHGHHHSHSHSHSHSQGHAAYGAPPLQGGGYYYNGIPVPPPPGAPPAPPPAGIDGAQLAESVRKATKGFGTDEKLLISTIAPLDAFQVDALSKSFKSISGKEIVKVLEKETSGWFEYALRLKVLGPLAGDCWLLNRACDGAGTHEDLLNEVLLARSNADMWALKQAYKSIYGKDLERVVEGELSVKTKRIFSMAMNGNRTEENVPPNPSDVSRDVQALKSAARGMGTDEITICSILVGRSQAQLVAIAREYQHKHGALSSMVRSEFSGHMRDALLFIADGAERGGQGIERDAQLLENAMAGMGTKDERLTYRLIRLHWNRHRFNEVKMAYAGLVNKKGLRSRVAGETSGDYGRFLEALVGH
ncbi:Annexin [Ceraceosorus guamensis]|uniref:Annexin n=1 Tax=Ceraceosorus guamensis TaxID=1522189 RepID=A0A316W3H7_9BASI|nr:Annexin [Ceraceosorus guamensis]PWN42125.1 Annexin [Ceraceosorus guamensis]